MLLPLPGFGPGSTVQWLPAPRRITVSLLSVFGSTNVPTAQTLPSAVAMPYRLVQLDPADAGRCAVCPWAPWMRSMTGRPPLAGLLASPAAHA
jgi:hypothetical protein